MQGIKRKIVYVAAYEVFGWVISSVGLALLADSSTTVADHSDSLLPLSR